MAKVIFVAVSFPKHEWSSGEANSIFRKLKSELGANGFGGGWDFALDDMFPVEQIRAALEKHLPPERARTIAVTVES